MPGHPIFKPPVPSGLHAAARTPKLLEEVASNPKEKYRAETAALLRETLAMKCKLDY